MDKDDKSHKKEALPVEILYSAMLVSTSVYA